MHAHVLLVRLSHSREHIGLCAFGVQVSGLVPGFNKPETLSQVTFTIPNADYFTMKVCQGSEKSATMMPHSQLCFALLCFGRQDASCGKLPWALALTCAQCYTPPDWVRGLDQSPQAGFMFSISRSCCIGTFFWKGTICFVQGVQVAESIFTRHFLINK